ncbi:MAG: hypothetical protein JNL01_08070 [Bdellovibrionales bacterium]|nr:hypothetical protein [Bdellovibrionales bacterium]
MTQRIFILAIVGVQALGLCACGFSAEDNVLTRECVIGPDQGATLMGRFPRMKIPIAVAAGQFSGDEARDIENAVQTWNSFTRVSLGEEIFDMGGSSIRESSVAKPSNSRLCSTSLIDSRGEWVTTRQVVIYKSGTWNSSIPNAIAVTAVCRSGGSPFNRSYMASMDLNYQNFFVDGRPIPDLRSIVTHELGHLLGLDHSCTGDSGRNGFPSCSDSGINSDYLNAVMFPSVFFNNGLGEVRRALNINDQGRANCLYQDISPAGQQQFD